MQMRCVNCNNIEDEKPEWFENNSCPECNMHVWVYLN